MTRDADWYTAEYTRIRFHIRHSGVASFPDSCPVCPGHGHCPAHSSVDIRSSVLIHECDAVIKIIQGEFILGEWFHIDDLDVSASYLT